MKRLIFPLLFILTCNLFAARFDYKPAKKSNVAYIVYCLDDDETVLEHNPEKSFRFASNLKLLTSLAALHYLGTGYRYTTLFGFDPAKHVLYIKGGGDPTTVIEDFDDFRYWFGVKGITGIDTVVVDDYRFGEDGFRPVEGIDETGNRSYLAYASGLSLNYNSVFLSVTPGRIGQPANVFLRTPGEYFTIDNDIKTTTGKKRRLRVSSVDNGSDDTIMLGGTIGGELKRLSSFSRMIHHPTEHYVRTLLHMTGNKPATIVRRELPDSLFLQDGIVPFDHHSKPLRDIVETMNIWSSNMIAETLKYTIGDSLANDPDMGIELIKRFARDELGHEIDIVNGSGLGNSANHLTASLFMDVMKYACKDPQLKIDFLASLPVYGEEGTLVDTPGFEDGTCIIRAKTGLLSDVAAMTGMMVSDNGKTYLFTFVVNEYPEIAEYDRVFFRNRFVGDILKYLNGLK